MLERPQLRLKCYPSCDFYCRGNGGKGLKKKPVEKLAGKRAELYPGERELKWEKVFLAVGPDAFLVVLHMRGLRHPSVLATTELTRVVLVYDGVFEHSCVIHPSPLNRGKSPFGAQNLEPLPKAKFSLGQGRKYSLCHTRVFQWLESHLCCALITTLSTYLLIVEHVENMLSCSLF